ncbi:MAG: Peptidase S1 and S6, chymotrypsin/Hap [Candidatus Curtissbacteria bacterium GW2011_GWC2_38_9]|uniref:Uncharacterized protein n=3 Tax=Candidatus Curtissiibacteriota TaxID=1752717 RepID=A0A1F5HPI2_9BACT|nr:MAG: Peptidase S1 and S6, chymotrypsin/Hap [Candidatus Curtissbacteria bacterium GW2011_GWC2_38_9]KKS05090.1 MAG: Peptidase S1 and S6, chymotrypsin/Hap [Candidatus Curtissbacteria bacterium GW2011_GWA2_41_24]OGE06051.1 MAG: hypothetical protein A2W70_05560 [Candidatus Curtissbacteria bacterium RIFCSPLOWO2_02_41_11]
MRRKNKSDFSLNYFLKYPNVALVLGGILFLILIFNQYFDFSLKKKDVRQIQPSPITSCDEAQAIQKVKESVIKIKTEQGEGTGFIIRSDGYILTSFHLVETTNSPRIIFPDNTSLIGKVFNWDEQTDLAVIKVEKNDLKTLKFGDSDKLTAGQSVIAIGFPYLLPGEATVTKGSFSAKRASDFEGIEFIQIDAALNPGNSGGPTINSCGEVIGINTLSISEAEGLGFAISSKTANSMSDSLISTGPKQFKATQLAESANLNFQDVVSLYYSFISIRQLEAAYNLFSENFIEEIGSLQNFKNGFKTTLNVYLTNIEVKDIYPPLVYVELVSADLVGNQVVFRNYKGTWSLVQRNGEWKLDDANIVEINK